MGESNFQMLEKLFGVFYKLSLRLQVFAAHRDILLGSPKAQVRCGKAYANLLQVVANATLFYHKKSSCTYHPVSRRMDNYLTISLSWRVSIEIGRIRGAFWPCHRILFQRAECNIARNVVQLRRCIDRRC
jgi:hypothetical protein